MSFKLRKPNPKGETRVSLCSIEGYKDNSLDKDNDFNVIRGDESGTNLTMKGVSQNIIATDNLGNTKQLTPGEDNIWFPGNKVTERRA